MTIDDELWLEDYRGDYWLDGHNETNGEAIHPCGVLEKACLSHTFNRRAVKIVKVHTVHVVAANIVTVNIVAVGIAVIN